MGIDGVAVCMVGSVLSRTVAAERGEETHVALHGGRDDEGDACGECGHAGYESKLYELNRHVNNRE